MRRKEEEQGAGTVRWIGGTVFGGALALLICMLLLLLASVGISAGVIPERFMVHCLFAGCVIGGFCGGAVAVRRSGAGKLLAGLSAGAVMLLLIVTVGSLTGSLEFLEGHGVGIGLSCLIGGMTAGLLRGKPKKKRRK